MSFPEKQRLPGVVGHAEMANAIRALAMDAVEAANSGHPGMHMGMADVATVLFNRHLKFDPAWPEWPDRDRFVLSAGHGSMLLYAVLHLTGYEDFSLEELKNFRQLGSRTAGHPEYGLARGIETTTGPLGQGLANAVGMALAERLLAERFGAETVDHFTYVIASDGCLMEGLSHEAASFAGHLRLGKLIVLFDDNQITIDGPTELATSDDHVGRFAAYDWHVQEVDGHHPDEIADALVKAREDRRPSLIVCGTIIGFGAPNKQGSDATHGAPLGAEEGVAAREMLGWSHPPFEVPDEIRERWLEAGGGGKAASQAWRRRFQALAPAQREAFESALEGALPTGLDAALDDLKRRLVDDAGVVATRKASLAALEVINGLMAETIGGSADLTGSVNTKSTGMAAINFDDYGGRYLHYGVREHAMAAVMNGLALHGGFIPYGGTFLIFADYARPAMRLSALMGQRVIYVMTHDSIGLGEDGPTHQPVEHLASLRAIPNLNVFRPADAVETVECWALALKATATPSVLVLTRQSLPAVRRQHGDANLCARGGYELVSAEGEARVTLIATGSEVALALEARALLQAEGIGSRVVSLPCWELFEGQDDAYRAQVLGKDTVRVAVEAAAPMGWDRYVGEEGGFVGMTGFGASAPYQALYEHFAITPQAVVAAAKERLG
ncbi:MAG: transketolase [Alphaproteobacteria bacterium]|nr:transketolase [Alphaproteobacteria bacterium]